MLVVKTSSKGQILLPKEIRKKLNIKPGQKLSLRLVGDHAEIKPLPQDPIEHLCGVFKNHPESLGEALLKDRQKDRDREWELMKRGSKMSAADRERFEFAGCYGTAIQQHFGPGGLVGKETIAKIRENPSILTQNQIDGYEEGRLTVEWLILRDARWADERKYGKR